MSSRPGDTSPAAWSEYEAALARLSGEERVRIAVELSEAARSIRLAGLRARHPELSEEEIRNLLVWEDYGVALPGFVPPDAPDE